MEPENLEYNPVENNFYTYKPKWHLNKFLENINLENYNNINICAYEVNNEGKSPFLKILLVKSIFDNLSFPKISICYENNQLDQLFSFVELYLHELLSLDNSVHFAENIEINGFYEYNCELFLFIDLTKCKLNINDIYSSNNVWFAVIDEILNKRHICNIRIDALPYKFFNDNYDLCILLNEKGEAYETPMIGYVGKLDNNINFTYTFGVSKKDANAILGPYYYFTDFNNAIKEGYALSKNCEIKRCGIVRFALFTGTTKYIENFPDDDIDVSEVKKERLQDDKLDKNYEHLTMRITDHDGKWADNFDSCYLGNIFLDNGELLCDTPIIVVRDYNQQIPLSYHYINKKSLENTEEPMFSNVYKIL